MRAYVTVFLALVLGCTRSSPPHVTVGVAAVMRRAMPALVVAYEQRSGDKVDVVYGASDALAARAGTLDAIVLADRDAFATIPSAHPAAIATTQLVLVGPAGSTARFASLGTEIVLAIGDPQRVPAGRYARTYLEAKGLWATVAPRLVYGGDVAGVLALARRGTSHAAIVYATDVVDATPLVVLDRASDGPVVTVLADALRSPGQRFTTFLASPAARAVLARHGFGDPAP